jgi:glycosyltransferase involved in cell wall biosynthesis
LSPVTLSLGARFGRRMRQNPDSMATPVPVSVITPVFNGARYIQSCLENVRQQRVPGLEHIVVDGGSTDGTVEIAGAYAKQHDGVRLLVNPGQRQSDAMNCGTDAARGDFIAILNADDFFEPGALQRALAHAASLRSPGLIVGNCALRDGSLRILKMFRPIRNLSLRALLCGYMHPINPSSYLYHRALHHALGGYRADLDYTMDVDFIYRALEVAAEVRRVDEHWGNMVEHEGSKTVQDRAAGRREARLDELQQEYLRRLPWWQRSLIVAVREGARTKRRLLKLLAPAPS